MPAARRVEIKHRILGLVTQDRGACFTCTARNHGRQSDYKHGIGNYARTDARHDLLSSLVQDSVVVRASNHAGASPEQAEDQKQPAARVAGGDIAALSHTALVRKGEVARIVLVREADFYMDIRQPRLSQPILNQFLLGRL